MYGFKTSLVACSLFLGAANAFSGRATFFTPPESTPGVCGVIYTSSQFVVALNTAQFTSADCGKTLTITGNGATVNGTVQDSCASCGLNNLDLTASLFEQFAPLSVGLIPITWVFA